MLGPDSTLRDLFREGLRRGDPAARFLRPTREGYRPIAAAEFAERTSRAASALLAHGIAPGDRVALLSYNRPDWAVVDYACHEIGAVVVPLYSTLPADQVEYILRDSGAKLVFAEDAKQVQKLPAIAGLQVATFDAVPGRPDFEAFLARGAAGGDPPGPKAEDLATIVYTSGTTGKPKGVMLTHRNVVSNAVGCLEAVWFNDRDLSLSFLPLSHAFQRLVDYAIFLGGGRIAYAESVESIARDLPRVDPTILCSVPRIFEKFHDKVVDGVEGLGGWKRGLARWAIGVGEREAEHRREGRSPGSWLRLTHWVARALVLDRIRRQIGGRLRLFVSGGAPLGAKENVLFHALGFTLLEGYGLSETSPVITINRPGRTRIGTVGVALSGVEVKIAPEDGEILVKGPNVMKGYFNLPEETAAAFKDGYFCTGDIGEVDRDGFLRITDRKKDLLKTSGGKYVAPGPIEGKIRSHPYVARAVVLGDNRKFAAALVVPDFGVLESRYPGVDRKALTTHPPVLEELKRHLDGVNAGLGSWETVKKFALVERDFSVERGELTPTLKVKRKAVEQNFRDQIENLFS